MADIDMMNIQEDKCDYAYLKEWFDAHPTHEHIDTKLLTNLTKQNEDKVYDPSKELYKEIEEFIKNRYEKEKHKLSPYTLHAQISGYLFEGVRNSINNFFDENKKFTRYGNSSSYMRSHNLYRGDDNLIYVVHLWGQEISDVFYLSRSELETYFDEDHIDSMPDYDDPPEVNNCYL